MRVADAGEADPMDVLDVPGSRIMSTDPSVRNAKRRKTKPEVVQLTMPARCPSANPRSTTHVKIRALSSSHFGKMIWIAAPDIAWLVLYLAEETATGGVNTAVADVQLLPNCAVPWLHMRANLKARGVFEYERTFTDGPLKDVCVRASSCAFTADKWIACLNNAARWQA